ncbi:hypothetical protein AAG906_009016 [Vitis piasezkii]
MNQRLWITQKKTDTPSLFREVEFVSGRSFQTQLKQTVFHLLWVLNNQTEFCETSVRLGPKISKTVKGREAVEGFFPRVPVKEFWLLFHRFLNYQKAFNYLQQAIS